MSNEEQNLSKIVNIIKDQRKLPNKRDFFIGEDSIIMGSLSILETGFFSYKVDKFSKDLIEDSLLIDFDNNRFLSFLNYKYRIRKILFQNKIEFSENELFRLFSKYRYKRAFFISKNLFTNVFESHLVLIKKFLFKRRLTIILVENKLSDESCRDFIKVYKV